MKKITLALFMLSSVLMAGPKKGEAELVGNGRVSKKPEFAYVQFNVKSLCYATPEEATKANDEAAVQIQEMLEQYVDIDDSDIDEVQTNGGAPSDYSKTIYGEHTTTVCENTFQQTTRIIWKTDDIAGFSKDFATAKIAVNRQFARAEAEGSSVPQTFVNISEPAADVCEETRAKMSLEAQSKARENAEDRFFATVGQDCDKAKIVKFTDQVESYRSSPSYAARELSSVAPGDRPVRISFEDITVSASTTVTFKFKQIKIRNNCPLKRARDAE